ncbi:MAG: protein kinase [Gemmatimonadota bacterium]|jgi:serine/threonine-protein kinase
MASPENTEERLRAALADRYRIEREIGSGGMATVYLAQDLKHNRKVAVKVLRPEVGHQLGVDRFLREIRIAATLSHPNILPLFDSGDADGLLYYVMPYIEDNSLAERIEAQGALPVEEAVAILREIGEALARAHGGGVVHRDIKPQNILFESGHVRVADFGLARALTVAGGERLTRTGIAVGTPHYMSPEQGAGESSEDVRSDVYSLGCLAYELLVGTPPYTGSNAQAVVAGHLSKPVPSVRERRPEVPRGVEAAVQRALAKDPEDRFQTVVEMTEALTHAMTVEAREAEERRAARRRWNRAFVGIGTIAAVVLGGWWGWKTLTAPAIQVLAVLPASNMTRDPEQDLFVDGVHEALVTELNRAGINVIARQSVLQYRDTDKPVRQIASELHVDALIQPAVGRDGDSVVVDVSILEASSELPIYTRTFGAKVQGVLGLYREVSAEIAGAIGAALTEQAEARLAERPTVDPQVVDYVLQGNFHLGRLTPQDLTIALDYFQMALDIDSLYAPAHAGVANVWAYRSQMNIVPPLEARRLIDGSQERALELDPGLVAARCDRATVVFWNYWEYEEGLEEMGRCLDDDPNDARNRALYGHMLMILGRPEEAREQGERAVELDPLNAFVRGLYGTILACTGPPQEAIQYLESMFEDNPGAGFGYFALATAYRRAGLPDEEIRAYRTEQTLVGDEEIVAALEQGMEAGGSREARRRAAEVMAGRFDQTYVSALSIAGNYRDAGEVEKALGWLERALEQHNQGLPYISFYGWDQQYDDPRFQAVMEEIGVPLLGQLQFSGDNPSGGA